MRKAGITRLRKLRPPAGRANSRPAHSPSKCSRTSLEEMERQALRIAAWGSNVYVKIPVTNTRGESIAPVGAIGSAAAGRQGERHGMMTLAAGGAGARKPGRCGPAELRLDLRRPRRRRRPRSCCRSWPPRWSRCSAFPQIELIWASPRELLNIMQAEAIGCHIITGTPDLLKKLPTGRQGPGRSIRSIQ